MKLKDIFTSKELTAAEKVAEISAVVNKARKAYGNTEKVIKEPEVNTCEGIQDLSMLDDESKVALAEREVQHIKIVAVESTKAKEGVVLDRKIEELIAISPILVNISKSTESDYL